MNKKEFVVNPNDPFYIAIKTVFENWTALKVYKEINRIVMKFFFKLAVSNEFAGSETKEIAEWFLNATYQWIVETGDLDDDELEPFFYNTMNNEFNTIIEDNSCLQIARLLIRFYALYKENRLQELHDELMKRYTLAQGSIQASQKCKTEQDVIKKNRKILFNNYF